MLNLPVGVTERSSLIAVFNLRILSATPTIADTSVLEPQSESQISCRILRTEQQSLEP
ncbi:MAG: hypothetical protein ACTSQ7_06300 [Alphaproteobacteria bacterium]